MSLIHVKQGTPEWLHERNGHCTASRVKDALSLLKTGPQKGQSSAARRNYMIELISERWTGFAAEHYVSPAMEWGIETEKYARAAYEVVSGNDVDLVGLYAHDAISGFLASPDGIIGEDGLVEIKCPNTTTHIDWMLEGVVPEEHVYQCMAQMACSVRQWVDFVSFDPRVKSRHQLFIKRLERNEGKIAEMEAGVVRFLADVDEMIARLDGLNPLTEQLKQSIEEEELGIRDEDMPDWWKESVSAK